jgi:WS/DGAT/MGAT family acyltransferase
VPGFRQRVLEPPGRVATPRWCNDPGFDLAWHLRRVNAPVPHTPDTVIAMARNAAMTAFDRARPLWEFTLVEQLEGGRAALIMKLHHSLTDGLGGMQLMLTLFDVEPVAVPRGRDVECPDGEELGPRDLFVAGLARQWERGTGFVRRGVGSAVPSALRAARRPLVQFGEVVETARSIVRTVAPVRDTLSPVMRERGLTRHLEMLEVDLADLKRAAAAGGGSVNDAFLAAVAGGFRRYHERHGESVERLRVTLPISIRKPDDPVGGNRITLIRFSVPVGARVGRCTAFGPTIGTAANLTLLSYDGSCCIGVTIDEASIADPDVFAECLCEGFDEVLALGGEHTPARLPLRDERLPLRDDGLPLRDVPRVRVAEPAWSA